MAYILEHLPQSFIVLGLILLAVEVLVFGFSTFVLFFIGIAAIVTGGLLAIEVIPGTMLNALLTTAIISVVIAILGWKPMKNIQNKVDDTVADNDMIGHQFTLSADLELGQTITYRYSGIDWQVKSKQQLGLGTEVKIVEIAVGLMTVEPV